jgi:5-methylcytosine-specific restriction protein A
MPFAAPRPCRFRGCPKTTTARHGYCVDHEHGSHRWVAAGGGPRASATERGYGWNWTRLRNRKIRTNPLCEICEKEGRIEVATQVDHILSKDKGGDDSWENLMSLCRRCHDLKTARER